MVERQGTELQERTSKMRWLIVALFMVLSACTQPEVKTIGGTYDYQGTTPHKILKIAEAIRLEWAPNAKIYIISEQPLTYGVSGLANQVGPHTYLIQLDDQAPDPGATIFHEMGHIIDAEQGRLDFTGHMYWEGKRCDWTIPWHERPWEISANQWRDCLIYDYNNRLLEHYDYALEDWLEAYKINLIWLK